MCLYECFLTDFRSASPGRRSPPVLSPGEIKLHLTQLKIRPEPEEEETEADSGQLTSLDTSASSSQPSPLPPPCQVLVNAALPWMGL